jgi:hypothetical protein
MQKTRKGKNGEDIKRTGERDAHLVIGRGVVAVFTRHVSDCYIKITRISPIWRAA